MIENLDELTSEQKNNLQEFVSIAHKNKNLWWENGDLKGKLRFLYLENNFSVEIDSLNELFIAFPVEETNLVLQILTDGQCAKDIGFRKQAGLDAGLRGLYAFRFKKYEDMVNKVKLKIPNPSEFDTKQLLEELQNILRELKEGKFTVLPPWHEET